MAGERAPFDEDSGGGGYNLLAYLVPVGLIVGVVIYLLASNPGTQDALNGDEGTRTAAATAVVAATSSPTPTAIPSVVPAAQSTLSIGDPFLGFGRSIPRWDSATRGWDTSGVEWEGVLPRWWQDGPRVQFVTRQGNVYLFHADGLLPGETIAPDGVSVAFNPAGWRVQPRRIRLAAAPHSGGTGLDIRVTFDRDLAGLISPTVTLAVEGSRGSQAQGSAPYVHEGTRPELAYRLSQGLNQIVASDRVRIVSPAELPANSTVQWADYVVGTHLRVRAIGWLVPTARGWVSLVAAQTASCAVPIEVCFGAAAPVLNAGIPVELGGREWLLGRVEEQWVALGKVDETFVVLTAPDRDLVTEAAASMQ